MDRLQTVTGGADSGQLTAAAAKRVSSVVTALSQASSSAVIGGTVRVRSAGTSPTGSTLLAQAPSPEA
jgi:hypothetical protein